MRCEMTRILGGGVDALEAAVGMDVLRGLLRR